MNIEKYLNNLQPQIMGLVMSALLCSPSLAASQNRLDLLQVLKNVERHYPQIKIARLEVDKAHGTFVSTLGKFDPSLEATGRSQPMGGYINQYGDAQLTIPTFYNGLKLFAGYRNGDGNWPIYYQNYLTNSGGEYRTGISFPLLRDRLIDKNRTRVQTSSQTISMKQEEAEALKIKIYQEAITAYWQWVEAGLQVKIFNELLQLAKQRQHAIEEQANQGDLAQLVISENMQQIKQREQFLNRGLMVFEQASVNLSLYYRDTNGVPVLLGKTALPQLGADIRNGDQGPISLTQHPAIKKIRIYEGIVKLKRDLANNDLLPQLDATAYTFKQNGSGGYPSLVPQAAMVGLSFKFPLYQREAKGKLIEAQSELRQVKVQKKFLYDQLKNEYSRMKIGVKRGMQQLHYLNKELELAQKVQEGETRKFNQGDSTLFLVNQREQMTTQVQLSTLHAKIDLEELKAKLQFFITTQLEKEDR